MLKQFSVRAITLAAALAVAAPLMIGCAGAQRPPAEGQCNMGREWVPPVQREGGQWTEGYCRNVR